MPVQSVDFDDVPEDNNEKEATVTTSFKLPVTTRDMLAKIAHRERHNMSGMGTIIIEDYINDYVKKYNETKEPETNKY